MIRVWYGQAEFMVWLAGHPGYALAAGLLIGAVVLGVASIAARKARRH